MYFSFFKYSVKISIAEITKVLMQIADKEPINSNDLIFLADARWSNRNKTDVP